MSNLIPTASACHKLQLPPIERDDRLNLHVRTGLASTLYSSFVFTHGGLTIGLELAQHSLAELAAEFELRINNAKSACLADYVLGELFYLRLIERAWLRVVLAAAAPRPLPRLWHEMCAINNCVYVFGGVCVVGAAPAPCNDLWEFNLEHKQWTCLHNGDGWQSDALVPQPRFLHKMTPIHTLSFHNTRGHYGLLIAGGKDARLQLIYDNVIFDLVEKRYVGCGGGAPRLRLGAAAPLKAFTNADADGCLCVNYIDSIIVSVADDVDHTLRARPEGAAASGDAAAAGTWSSTSTAESIIVYAPVVEPAAVANPLVSFRVGKTIKEGKMVPTHAHPRPAGEAGDEAAAATVPYNLRYPTGGLFGSNLVITGFLPGDYDISIFIFNRPTGKWLRLNVYCSHDYGTHRFWGGFAWQSHHKVVLLGNNLTLNTTSSIRFFSLMITVNLPITNILASSELEGGRRVRRGPAAPRRRRPSQPQPQPADSDSDRLTAKSASTSSLSSRLALSPSSDADSEREPDEDDHEDAAREGILFNDYVHYAAPKTNFTTIRLVFPPAAVTLGRIAFNRYADLILDFEFVTANGDRIPVSLKVLIERWGRHFIELLARGYVQAVENFESTHDADAHDLRASKSLSRSLSLLVALAGTSTSSGRPRSSSLSAPGEPRHDSWRRNSVPLRHHTFHVLLAVPKPRSPEKDAPQFRLPFQGDSPRHGELEADARSPGRADCPADAPAERPADAPAERPACHSFSSAVDPHQLEHYLPRPEAARRELAPAPAPAANPLFASNLQNIPPQLPLPDEAIPAVPHGALLRLTSRRLSGDLGLPRLSLIHTLTVLRNIPGSPSDSPLALPRTSVSGPAAAPTAPAAQPALRLSPLKSPLALGPDGDEMGESISNTSSFDLKRFGAKIGLDLSNTLIDSDSVSLDNSARASTPAKAPSIFDGLLNLEEMERGSFRMEPLLIPRKLYIPLSTVLVKGFCEFLYTGQVGNKWLLSPTTLDNLAMLRYYKAPLLYDLISEVLFGIIGRKEVHVAKEGRKLKRKYFELIRATGTALDESFRFPLDEYMGLLDTFNDGHLDIALMKKASESHHYRLPRQLPRQLTRLLQPERSSPPPSSLDVPISPRSTVASAQSNDAAASSEATSSSHSDGEAEFRLGYLDAQAEPSPVGPRSKSVFDKTAGEVSFHTHLEALDDADERERASTLTLEQLVSPQAPVPLDYVIALIHEAGTLTTDMKLLLRATNVQQMLRILAEWRDEIEHSIAVLQQKYNHQVQQQRERERATHASPEYDLSGSLTLADAVHRASNASQAPTLKPTASTASLHTMGSDKARANLRLGSFTPFAKKPTMDKNKELDKRITKMIKKDEKQKVREEKDRRVREAQQVKLEKHRRKQDEKLHRMQPQYKQAQFASAAASGAVSGAASSAASGAASPGFSPVPISRTSTADAATKKAHSLFYNLSHPMARSSTVVDDPRSASDTNLMELSKSAALPRKHGFFHLKKAKDEAKERPPLHSQRLASSLHSGDSKKSLGTSGSAKKRFLGKYRSEA